MKESSLRSVTFVVKLSDNKHLQFQIDDLHADITTAKYKAKSNRFILTLKKAEDETWTKLKKSS